MICERDTDSRHLLPSSRRWLVGSNVRDEIILFVPPRVHHQLPCSSVSQRHKRINMPQTRLSHPVEHPLAVRGGLLWEHVLAAPRGVVSFPNVTVPITCIHVFVLAPPLARVHLQILKENLAVVFPVPRRCVHSMKGVLCSTCFDDNRKKPMTESVQGLVTTVLHSCHNGAMVSPTS